MKPRPVAEYETKAKEIAERLGLKVNAQELQGATCPTWDREKCKKGQHAHGRHYRVTIGRKPSKPCPWTCNRLDICPHVESVSFDYWGSLNDMQEGWRPRTYDILSCVSSDMYGPTDPDEVAEEYGPMKPPRAIAAAKHAARLQAFFTEAERDALSEIQ